MQSFSKILFLSVALLSVFGCIKRDDFSNIPDIEFEDFVLLVDLNDTTIITGELTFNFTDGDGDIGFRQEDTLPPYNRAGDHYYNFFMEYLVKKDGEFVKQDLLVPFYYRVPYLQPEGKARSLQGSIAIRDITVFTQTVDADTIKFQFHMEDRALNKSNVVLSPEIVRPRF